MTVSKKLLELFESERLTHLKTIAEEIRKGQTTGFDEKGKQILFRAAHSLKGAARLVLKHETETHAHELESLIQQLDLNSDNPEIVKACIEKMKMLGALQQLLEVGITTGTSSLLHTESNLIHLTDEQVSHLLFLASEVFVVAGQLDRERADSSNPIVERLLAAATKLKNTTARLQLVPLEEVVLPLTTIASHVSEQLGKQVKIKIRNVRTLLERSIVKRLDPCFIQLIRNAIDHGIETPTERTKKGKSAIGQITIDAYQRGVETEIRVNDDGAGIDEQLIKDSIVRRGLHDASSVEQLTRPELFEFLFLPEFSSRTEVSLISGRGIGLDIVRDTLRSLGGEVTLESSKERGTTFILRFPSRVASIRSIVVDVSDTRIALPLTYVERILSVDNQVFHSVDDQTYLLFEEQEIPYYTGASIFTNSVSQTNKKGFLTSDAGSIVVLKHSGKTVAIHFDRVRSEEDLIIQQLDSRFEGSDELLGIAIGRDQRVISIINIQELLFGPALQKKSIQETTADENSVNNYSVLIIDDSVTVRELEKRLLTQAGFQCETACDGKEGYERLQHQRFDIVITDIDMPRMTGFDLLEALQKNGRKLPAPFLVVSYKERLEDRERGISLGASGYLSKGSFKDATFIQTVRDILQTHVQRGRYE